MRLFDFLVEARRDTEHARVVAWQCLGLKPRTRATAGSVGPVDLVEDRLQPLGLRAIHHGGEGEAAL
jgi:hypothetical protein